MKKVYILPIISLFLILNISCKENEKSTEKDYLASMLKTTDIDATFDWVVILPGLGCKGCIQEAETFMREHVANNKVLFVLTKVESLKILQKKTGIHIKDHTNIFVDRDDEFNIPTDNSIYPCIVEVDTNKYVAHEFQSPKNVNAFEKLKERLMIEQ